MFKNVFTKTLRDQRFGLIGWSIGLLTLVAMIAFIWPSVRDMSDLEALMDQYPEALKEMFNIQSIATPAGYINAELYSLMIPAMFIIYGVSRGSKLIAGEEEGGSLEVLLSVPRSRTYVLVEKAGALATSVLVLGIVLWLLTMACSAIVSMGLPPTHSFIASVAMVAFGLEFGFLALGLSAATGKRAVAMSVAGGLAVLFYAVFVISQLVEGLKFLQYITPFYQGLHEGPVGGSISPLVLVMLAIGLAALYVGARVFEGRDIRS